MNARCDTAFRRLSPPFTVVLPLSVAIAVPDLWGYRMGNSSGTFPNYGQLVVGVPPGHPTSGDPGLSVIEQQSHFSLVSARGPFLCLSLRFHGADCVVFSAGRSLTKRIAIAAFRRLSPPFTAVRLFCDGSGVCFRPSSSRPTTCGSVKNTHDAPMNHAHLCSRIF